MGMIDYKERYTELLETNKQLEKELKTLLASTGKKNGFPREMIFNTFHSGPHLMAISNLDSGKYADVNNAFLKTFGLLKEEVIGHTSDDIRIFTDFEESNKFITRISKLNKIKDYPVTLRTKDGVDKPFLFSAETVNLNNEIFLLTIYNEIRISNETKIKENQELVLDGI